MTKTSLQRFSKLNNSIMNKSTNNSFLKEQQKEDSFNYRQLHTEGNQRCKLY